MINIELPVFVDPEVYYFGSILNLVLGFHSYCNGHVQFHVITMFRFFWKHFQEMFLPFVPVLRFLEFLVEWKVPIVSHLLIAILYPSQSYDMWNVVWA